MGFQYGEEQVAYLVAESTYGVAVVPAATDAFRCSSFNITPNYDRPEVPETGATRSLQERVTGRKGCTWSISFANRPSGTAGTPPDYHLALKHALGSYTNNASTSDVYTPLKDPSALSLSGYRLLEGVLEGFYGGVVTNVTFNWSGDDFGTITVSGEAKDMLWAGTDAADGAGSTATTLIVDDGDFFSKYAVIELDGGASAIQVTAVSGENLTIAASTWSDNDVVTPYLPAPTLAGSPLYGTDGTLSLDGGATDISHISGSLSIDTGIGLYNRGFGTASATGVVLPSPRRVSGNLSFLIEDNGNYAALRGEAANATTQDIVVDVGTTSGSICQFDMSRCEFDAAPISDGSGLIEASLSFTALTSTATATEDELTLTYK
jgi:hypothetical protein